MELDLFKNLVDEIAGRVHQVNLFHRGESLLHPELGEMIRCAKGAGLRTRIHTNGTLLNREKAAEILYSGLDILSFSFDGYDKEMYEANRINACFEETVENIARFLRMKKAESRRRPFVVLELMEIGEYTASEFRRRRTEFLRRFGGLPLDKFVVRRPHNWAGFVDAGVGHPVRPTNSERIPCPLLWHALAVFWDGRVMPCCQDFFGDLELGSLRTSSLWDLWNGDGMRELRREMADPASLKRTPCVNCDRIVRTTFAGVPTDYLGRFLSESVLNYGWLSKFLPH